MAAKPSVASKNSRSGKSKLTISYQGKNVKLVVLYQSYGSKMVGMSYVESGELVFDPKTKTPVKFSKDKVIIS